MVIRSFFNFVNNKSLLSSFEKIASRTSIKVLELFKRLYRGYIQKDRWYDPSFSMYFSNVGSADITNLAESPFKPINPYLGKLGIKEEAAGKVRVFAMVDPWTQWVLRPLHKKLFGVLRRLPMDGTFDQLNPLKRVPFNQGPIYSFDLSAATDRLPIEIQKSIISCAYGKEFSSS